MKMFKKISAVCLATVMLLTSAVFATAETDVDYKITNPYEGVDFASYGQFKADLHSHTTFSDGHDTLPQSVERHYELGFDIYARTDHGTVSNGYINQEFNDPLKFISLIKNGGIYDDVLSESGTTSAGASYHVITDDASGDEYYIEGDGHAMLHVPFGNEQNPTSFNNAHVNTWFVDYGNGMLGGTSNYRDVISAVDDLGGLSVINHPGEYTNARDEDNREDAYNMDDAVYNYYISKFADLLMNYDTCIGIDINSKGDSRTRFDRKLWDQLLMMCVPNGRNVYAIATTDAHNLGIVDSGYTIMLMENNTSADLHDCMANGQFFAASKYVGCQEELNEIYAGLIGLGTPEALEFAEVIKACIDSGEKYYAGEEAVQPVINYVVVDDTADTISIDVTETVYTRWISNGKVIAEGNSIDLDDYSDVIGNYVRAEMYGTSGVVYSQAFTLEYDGAPTYELNENFIDFGKPVSLICDTIVKALPYILPLRLIFWIFG